MAPRLTKTIGNHVLLDVANLVGYALETPYHVTPKQAFRYWVACEPSTYYDMLVIILVIRSDGISHDYRIPWDILSD